jgi:hypothetical protein
MTCQPPPVLRVNCYRMMKKRRTATIRPKEAFAAGAINLHIRTWWRLLRKND